MPAPGLEERIVKEKESGEVGFWAIACIDKMERFLDLAENAGRQARRAWGQK
jgi:hypothetical protein